MNSNKPSTPVNRVQPDAMPDDFRQLWQKGIERTGDATLIEVLANAPHAMRHYFDGFYKAVFYNGDAAIQLDIRTKELLRLKLSKQHGCQYCNHSNAPEALAAGISQLQIDQLLTPTATHFDNKDLAVLEFAEQMMLQNQQGQLSEALYVRLKQFYSDTQIVEMGFVAAILTGVAKWLFTFDMVVREDNCPIPKQPLERD